MPGARVIQPLANKASDQERQYSWVAAIELYRQALDAALKEDEFSQAADISERIALCHYRAAMQAGKLPEFKDHMLQAWNSYDKAAELHETADSPGMQAKIRQCRAAAAYARSRCESDVVRRKELLDDCWRLGKEAMELYEGMGDLLNLGRTCSSLSACQVDLLDLEWDKPTRERRLKEALAYGEKAIAAFSGTEEERDLARAYCITSINYHTGALGLELKKRREYEEKAVSYAKKALELSKRAGDHLLQGLSHIWVGSTILDFTAHSDLAAEHFRSAYQCGSKTRDNYLKGRASYLLAHLTAWKMVAEEDPEKIREKSKECERHCSSAISYFSSVSLDQEIASSFYWLSENNITLASSTETTSAKKRALLKASVEAGRKGLQHAERSGSTRATWSILHTLSKSLFLLSITERDVAEKERLLKESLRYRRENIESLAQVMPHYFWNSGVYNNYLALIQAELAEIENEKAHKAKLLEEAAASAWSCINLCSKHGTFIQGQHAVLGGYYSDLSRILSKLHAVTGTPRPLGKSIEALEGAVQSYQKADLPSRAAESLWRLATTYDTVENHMEASKNFEKASKEYKNAAQKLPQLQSFYSEHQIYMQAWSEIEKARHHHARAEYAQAKLRYKNAARLHKSTQLWRYLAPNYSAWAQLEHSEAASRKEQTQMAIKAFKRTAELFGKAKESLERRCDELQDRNERGMVTELIRASDLRHQYCLGRMALEEAKIFDRGGDHSSSSRRYGEAAEIFEVVAEDMEVKSSRREVYSIIYLCRAWQRLTLAEAENSPNLFTEAAELFEKAKENGCNEKARALAMGHSHLCRGLEAGTRFEDTLDTTLHSTATRYLESAAIYYTKAGFKAASEYARATQRFFSAYMHVDSAQAETDPRKKTQHYRIAEKLLQASSNAYAQAKQLEKSKQVDRLLESVLEERKLAASLAEVLEAPEDTSTTTSFTTPTPSYEQAVGLEKFEHAHLQANLIAFDREVNIGEDITLEIELTNAGRGPATLVKVENMVPRGFKTIEIPSTYRMETCDLNMKRRILNPLKTIDLRVVAKALVKGVFAISPRIVYLDETGKQIFQKAPPTKITVRELGIKGWIMRKG